MQSKLMIDTSSVATSNFDHFVNHQALDLEDMCPKERAINSFFDELGINSINVGLYIDDVRHSQFVDHSNLGDRFSIDNDLPIFKPGIEKGLSLLQRRLSKGS